MKKKNQLNIVSVFTWLSNVVDTYNLSSSEQLVLLHLVKFLNRNFWKATKISNHMLARAIGKDDRTVRKALNLLVQKNLIVQKEGELHIGIEGAEHYFTEQDESDEPADFAESATDTGEQTKKIKTLANYLGGN